jgi:hypothetical protein
MTKIDHIGFVPQRSGLDVRPAHGGLKAAGPSISPNSELTATDA